MYCLSQKNCNFMAKFKMMAVNDSQKMMSHFQCSVAGIKSAVM